RSSQNRTPGRLDQGNLVRARTARRRGAGHARPRYRHPRSRHPRRGAHPLTAEHQPPTGLVTPGRGIPGPGIPGPGIPGPGTAIPGTAIPGTAIPGPGQDSAALRAALEAVRTEVGKAVIGQDAIVTGFVICLLCRGPVLLEGIPR